MVSRIKAFFGTYLPRKSWLFWLTVGFSVAFLVSTIMIGDLPVRACTLLLAMLNADLAYYRYYSVWRPERSDQFKLGADSIIELVHGEGIFKYKRGYNTYALYSNKVSDVKPPIGVKE